ncbi:Phosphomannomutase / phosphoglucomutase OS=Bosea thiooxidans OX=53254 GN=SAMN05660750_00598 PE=3 SV=1 [Bosea thiooxidans]
MLARDLGRLHPGAQFVVDVKSTGLFASDPALRELGVRTDYWKTGHSYIKRRVRDLQALAGFEKSGHFFFNAPVGRGYDDGLVAAIAVLDMLDRNPDRSMAELYAELPRTWGTPTMAAHCADEIKYDVAARVTRAIEALHAAGGSFADQPIRDVVTVNGVRVTVADGAPGGWCAPRPTSPSSSSSARVRSPRRACARCSPLSTAR